MEASPRLVSSGNGRRAPLRLATVRAGSVGVAPAPIRVLVADPDTLIRRGVSGILSEDPGIEVVAEAADGPTAVDRARSTRPAVVVLDVGLPDRDGIDAARRIAESLPEVRVLMLAARAEPVTVRESLRAGATGYVAKDDTPLDLVAAVRAVARGERYLSTSVQRIVVEQCLDRAAAPREQDPVARLTGRERQILQLVAEGRNNRQIAHLLRIAPGTVDAHRRSLMEKLGVHNVAQLVRAAVAYGIVR